MTEPSGQTDHAYVGRELDLFARAANWKSYFRSKLAPFIGRRVLEVGAGLGTTTRVLCDGRPDQWVCLEPDPTMAAVLADAVGRGELPACCSVRAGVLADLGGAARFDTVLYIDVLEHIEDDRAEVARAAAALEPGGHLLALSPAHQWLYSPFDKSIGHYRRYTRRTFGDLAPESLQRVKLIYLDAVGLLASLGNKALLRTAMPTAKQIALWDNLMVPASRWIDPLLGYAVGKSVVAVWRKRA